MTVRPLLAAALLLTAAPLAAQQQSDSYKFLSAIEKKGYSCDRLTIVHNI